MPKLTITANELVGTDADFVSLVKKGANRIPFRIIKEDQTDMIDLHSIAKTALAKSAAPTKPAVLAVVVAKTDNMDSIKAALVAAGLSVEKAEEKDGITVFKQEGVSDANPQTMKLNDEVALIVTGMQKGFESWDWQSTSLKDMFSTEGFYPSMWLGLDLLGATFGNIMQKAENPAEAKEQLSKAVDEFKSWLESLSGSIPEHAFKAEQLLKANDWGDEEVTDDKGEKSKKKTPKKKAAVTKEEVSANPLFGNATSTAQQPVNDAGNIDANPVHGNETPHASGGKQPNPAGSDGNIEGSPVAGSTTSPAPVAPAAAKKDGEGEQPDPNAALLASIGSLIDTKLTAAQKANTDAIAAVAGSVEKLDVAVKAVADRTQKMDVALNGTVDPGQPDDRQQHRQQKSASKAPPLLDTGLRPNSH